MKIKVYTNVIQGGWSPKDLETGIGGSEEILIQWAEYWAKKHDITIYMNGWHGKHKGVFYDDHRNFKQIEQHDVFISFKARHKLEESINAGKIYHWSHEIEPRWLLGALVTTDAILTLSDYHLSKMTPESPRFKVLGNFVDFKRMDKLEVKKKKGTMLYASSFDRGLEDILRNWPKVRKTLKLKKLYVTYGWEFMEYVIKNNPALNPWREEMVELLKQDGVELLGRITFDEMIKKYWESEYWCLPLNNPQGELFCINAVKAQYAGCKPVIRRQFGRVNETALNETVGHAIEWEELLKGDYKDLSKNDVYENMAFAQQFSLDDIMKEWETLLET